MMPIERADTEMRMPRNHQPQEHEQMVPNHLNVDMAKMMEMRFMPQDVTVINGLDSRTKCNAVELICKYLERCFVSKAFAWSSIEEPFDLCKLGIRHG
jgi:hypothetical protein